MWLCKRDLSRECKGKYRNCTDCILDNIRAEIEQKCCITVGQENEPAITLYDVFQIIDKYKAESEVHDANSN